jgi:biopolymer transport protein ExbD
MSASDMGDDGTVTGINVTPMVDIMLVLLVVFMVTANFVSQQSLKVNLPKTTTLDAAATASLTVVIDQKGTLFFREAKTDLESLSLALAAEARANPNVKVTVAADDRLYYKPVIAVLDAVRQAGITHVALASQR